MRSFDRPIDFAEQVEGGLAVLQRILLGCTLSAEEAYLIKQAAFRLITRVEECRRPDATDWDAVATITCPRCASVSTNAADIAQEYCGNCRAFHADLVKP